LIEKDIIITRKRCVQLLKCITEVRLSGIVDQDLYDSLGDNQDLLKDVLGYGMSEDAWDILDKECVR
jgi:hypothetical protein